MSTNLTDGDIEAILGILDGWPANRKLCWPALVETIRIHLGKSWSRQALDRHARIKDAFQLRKGGLKKKPAQNRGGFALDLQKALETIEHLEAENARLKNENRGLLEQFARWAYNAHSKGVSESVLNQPLPRTGRVSTRT